MTGWTIPATPGAAIEGIAVIFAVGATAIVAWTLVTRPTLLRGLLSDAEGKMTMSRLQLLIAAPTALATVSATPGHETAILAAFGASNLGYLTAKLSPILSRIIGGKQ